MRPRVVVVGPGAHAPGGIAAFTQRLAASFGADADAVVIAPVRLYPRWTRPGRTASTAQPLVPQRLIETLAWTPWTWRRARHAVAQSRPDLLVVQWWHPLFGPITRSLLRSANRAGARTVVVCHNARPHEAVPLWRWLTARVLRCAGEIVTMSDCVTADVRALLPRARLTQLEHPPNLDLEPRPRRARPPGAPASLLFFGNVRPYKGLADLLAALPHVTSRVPVRLTVAGRFLGSTAPYRRAVERLGLSGVVDLQDRYVPDEEVGALLSATDLLVLPYRSATQSGIVPLAAATGTPVVATRVGGLAAALGPLAVIAPPRDPAALAAAIVRALERAPAPPPAPRTGWQDWSGALLRMAVVR